MRAVFVFQLIENCVCLLRNLSYHVHHEIPGSERYQEAVPINQGPAPSGQKGGCFSSRKGKGSCLGDVHVCSHSVRVCTHHSLLTYNVCKTCSVALIPELEVFIAWLFLSDETSDWNTNLNHADMFYTIYFKYIDTKMCGSPHLCPPTCPVIQLHVRADMGHNMSVISGHVVQGTIIVSNRNISHSSCSDMCV